MFNTTVYQSRFSSERYEVVVRIPAHGVWLKPLSDTNETEPFWCDASVLTALYRRVSDS